MTTWKNKHELEELMQQCNDEEMYDVVICTEYDVQHKGLENVKMRYLNYINNYDDDIDDSINLTLKNPSIFVSASLKYVKITNMSECTNLNNLYSLYNTYTKMT